MTILLLANQVLQNDNRIDLESIVIKCNEYLMKAIIYIEKVLKMIISTGPYIEEYGPVIQQFSVLYQLMRLMNEETGENPTSSGTNDESMMDTTPLPTLYI